MVDIRHAKRYVELNQKYNFSFQDFVCIYSKLGYRSICKGLLLEPQIQVFIILKYLSIKFRFFSFMVFLFGSRCIIKMLSLINHYLVHSYLVLIYPHLFLLWIFITTLTTLIKKVHHPKF